MFEICLIIVLSLIVICLAIIAVTLVLKRKSDIQKTEVFSHRELWLYYMNEPELAGILSNNNGTGECKIDPNKMTEKQYRFLVLFLNHMSGILHSYKNFKKGWVDLFKNPCLRRVYEETKSYRNKKFRKLIDEIIADYKD